MPYIEVRGKYRTFRYDGDSPLDFTTYNNLLCVIRRPNINTFVTLQQYVPGQGGAFTTFQPGSSYTIVTRADGTQGNFNFDMGPYTRVDRLPSSTFLKSPNFYIGLDKNSIVVPISSYALSVNSPLSSVVNIVYVNGQGNRLQYVYADNFKTGAPVNFTHFLPNSGYELRNRIPFTFFAPLQSEMGNFWVFGENYGSYGMGHQYSLLYRPTTQEPFVAEQMYGNWVKTVNCNNNTLALSSCGSNKKLFVCGQNSSGQLGLGHNNAVTVFTNVPGNYFDIAIGDSHSLVVNENYTLLSCGDNTYGQLGLGDNNPRFTFTSALENIEIDPSSISAGGRHSLVRDQNGLLWSCGDNTYGQLGLGDTNPRNNFTYVSNIGFQKISANWQNSVIINNNRLYGCGRNTNTTSSIARLSFRYGTNNEIDYNTFVQEANGYSDVVDMWCGPRGIFIRRSNSNFLFACGSNLYGYLGMPCGGEITSQDNNISRFRQTIIPSSIREFVPGLYLRHSSYQSELRPYWLNNNSILQSLNLVTSYTVLSSPSIFTFNEYALNNIYGSTSSSLPGTVLFQDRSPAPSRTPTPTPTPTRTPTPTPTPQLPNFNNPGALGIGIVKNQIVNSGWLIFTTPPSYNIAVRSTGTPSDNNQQFNPPGTRSHWMAPYVYRQNQVYSIAYRYDYSFNPNGNFYLFKRNNYNGPIVNGLPTGIQLSLPNRGFIESLNGFGSVSNQTPNYRWRVDLADSPYSDKVGILYWSVDRTYPTNGTSNNETLYLRYQESSQALDLQTWSNTGASSIPNPDTSVRDTDRSNISYYPNYYALAFYVGPTLKYDRRDKPTGLYLKSTGNSLIQQLIYNNFFSQETFFVANGALGNAGGNDLNNYQLMLDYPMYTHCFNQFNRPVIFFNGFDRLPFSVNPSLFNTGSNYLKIFYKHTPQSAGTITNIFPLNVLRTTNDENLAYAYNSSYLYDIYFDEATSKIFVAYLDNWIIPSNYNFRPDTLKVAILAFNASTLTYSVESTETVVVNPVPAPTGPMGLNSPRIFKTSSGDITVSFSAQRINYQAKQDTMRFFVYRRTGNNSWTQVRGNVLIYMDNFGSVLSYR